MAEVVEHAVALPIDHSGFDDRVIEPRCANDFLSGPFRFVVGGPAIWARTKKTHEDDFSYSRLACRFHKVLCSLHMNFLIGLLSYFTVDASAMRNGVATGYGFSQLTWVRQVALEKNDVWYLS